MDGLPGLCIHRLARGRRSLLDRDGPWRKKRLGRSSLRRRCRSGGRRSLGHGGRSASGSSRRGSACCGGWGVLLGWGGRWRGVLRSRLRRGCRVLSRRGLLRRRSVLRCGGGRSGDRGSRGCARRVLLGRGRLRRRRVLLRWRVLLGRRGVLLWRRDLLWRRVLLGRGRLRRRRVLRRGSLLRRRVLLRRCGLSRRHVLRCRRRRRRVLRRSYLKLHGRRRRPVLRWRDLWRRTPLLRSLLPGQRERGNQKTQDTTEPTLHRRLHASSAPLVPPGNPPTTKGSRMILGWAALHQPTVGGRPPARQEIRHS